jgi:hypothetical protein
MPARKEKKIVDRRKELKRAYREQAIVAGVFQIRNLHTGRIFFGSSLNMHGPLDRNRFLLGIDKHPNEELQRDWNTLGPEAFAFEVLETIPPRDDPSPDYTEDLAILEQIWLDKLKPFGEGGYNREKRIRF